MDKKIMDIKYSVLMAVYIKDNPEWFTIAVDSMLNQTLKPSEVVIVKDGPVTTEIDSIIERKIQESNGIVKTVQLEKNSGLGEALRVGVLACSNEWIVRMDSDDYSKPDRCEKQFLAQRKYNVDLIGCDTDEFFGSVDNVVAHRVFPEFHDDIVKFGRRRTPFSHPNVVMRKEDILKSGNYQSAYLHEDYDLFVRMLMNGCKGYNLKEPLVCVRIGENFYARRGGFKYLKTLLKFNVHLLHIKWMHLSDFIIRSSANIVSCLMPGKLRTAFYKKYLRK